MEDPANLNELRALLHQRVEGLNQLRQDFLARVQSQSQSFQDRNAELLDQLEDYFDAHQKALEVLQQGSGDPVEPPLLLQGVEALKTHTGPMLDCMQTYGQAFLGAGESRFPLLNLIKNIGEGLRSGSITAPQAIESVIQARQPFEDGRQALNQLSNPSAGQQRKAEALGGIVAALEEAEQALRSKQLPRLKKIESAMIYLEQSEEALAKSSFMEGPTASPPANVLLNCVRGGLKGIQPLELVREALLWYRGYIERIEDQFDLSVAQQTDSIVILEELPKTRAVMDRHDEALTNLEEALQEEFLADTVEPILAAFEETVSELHHSSEVFLSVAQREAEVLCPKCSRVNPRVNRRCESCGTNLPQIPGAVFGNVSNSYEFKERVEGRDPDFEDGVVTENTYKIFEATYRFSEGQITADQLLAVVRWSRERLRITQNNMKTLPKEVATADELSQLSPAERESFDDTLQVIHETRELTAEALEDWAEGLDLLEEYAQTKSRSTAELAAKRIWESSQQLVRVQKISQLADTQLKDLESEAESASKAAETKTSEAPQLE